MGQRVLYRPIIYGVYSMVILYTIVDLTATRQGRSDGGMGYIGIYTPPPPKKKKISLTNYVSSLLAVLFTCGTLKCFDFEIGMTN